MGDPTVTLVELLTAQADEILKEILQGVERSRLPHFRSSDAEHTRQRVKAIFVLTTRAIKERNLSPMLAHAETLGSERFASGIDLAEVQITFNVMEEVLWQRILSSLPPASYGESFGLVGTVLRSGKEALARVYITLAAKSKTPTLNMEHLFDGLKSN